MSNSGSAPESETDASTEPVSPETDGPQPEPAEAVEPRGDVPPEGDSEDDADLVDRAEALADRVVSGFLGKVDLPDVRAEAEAARAFFKSIDSWAVWAVLLTYLLAAGAGIGVTLVGIEPVGALPDWYMHAAMYVAMFSFLILYVKAHLLGRRKRRAVGALLTLSQLAFFAWILFDRVPARTLIVVEHEIPRAVERPTFTLLELPAWLLIASAVMLLVHWLVLARFRGRAAKMEAELKEPVPQSDA